MIWACRSAISDQEVVGHIGALRRPLVGHPCSNSFRCSSPPQYCAGRCSLKTMSKFMGKAGLECMSGKQNLTPSSPKRDSLWLHLLLPAIDEETCTLSLLKELVQAQCSFWFLPMQFGHLDMERLYWLFLWIWVFLRVPSLLVTSTLHFCNLFLRFPLPNVLTHSKNMTFSMCMHKLFAWVFFFQSIKKYVFSFRSRAVWKYDQSILQRGCWCLRGV